MVDFTSPTTAVRSAPTREGLLREPRFEPNKTVQKGVQLERSPIAGEIQSSGQRMVFDPIFSTMGIFNKADHRFAPFDPDMQCANSSLR